jgi:conjugal transfer pilus assembly protein TraB
MKTKFLDWWKTLSPNQQKNTVVMIVGICTIAVVALGWSRSKAKGITINKEPAQRELSLDSSALDKSRNADYELRIAQQSAMIEALKSGKPVDPDKLAALDPRRQHDLFDPIERKNKLLDDSAERSLQPGDTGTSPGQANSAVDPNNQPQPVGVSSAPSGKSGYSLQKVVNKNGRIQKVSDSKNGTSSSLGTLPRIPPPPGLSSASASGALSSQGIIPMPGSNAFGNVQQHDGASSPDQVMGDIMLVSSPSRIAEEGKQPNTSPTTADSRDKKKELREVYLPPSFMEATLLSGLDAPTAGAAKGNPVPVLIRVKAPAVLPNDVKAELTGCFVIADGKGNLSTERAELTLVSISCLDRKGKALIDQKLKGFVVDADGKIGLRGRIVAKFGSVVARSMLAGFLVGAGDAFKAGATTSSVSPLGTTQTINTSQIGVAAVGNGLSEGFKEVQKFYMELAEASMPIVEIGPTKHITLVVSEGVNLEIKKIRGDYE